MVHQKEHKMLGTWINEQGNYELNIKKKKEKLNYTISIVKHQGRVCVFSCQVRIKLAETMIILYSSEAFPYIVKKELEDLEKIQLVILTQIFELPISTPFYALLMEVEWWTMYVRIACRKRLLYHNIMNSDNLKSG